MMHYNILLLSKENYLDKYDLKMYNYIHLRNAQIKGIGLTDEFTYDYLITDDYEVLSKFDLLTDGDCFITNCFFQSSIDEVFIIGHANQSKFDISYQIETIIDFLVN